MLAYGLIFYATMVLSKEEKGRKKRKKRKKSERKEKKKETYYSSICPLQGESSISMSKKPRLRRTICLEAITYIVIRSIYDAFQFNPYHFFMCFFSEKG
jgi:hypothetical protein